MLLRVPFPLSRIPASIEHSMKLLHVMADGTGSSPCCCRCLLIGSERKIPRGNFDGCERMWGAVGLRKNDFTRFSMHLSSSMGLSTADRD